MNKSEFRSINSKDFLPLGSAELVFDSKLHNDPMMSLAGSRGRNRLGGRMRGRAVALTLLISVAAAPAAEAQDDTAVNEVPRISLYLANSSVEENSDGIVVAYTAADPEGAELVWVLGGDDGDLFRVQQLGITPVYAVRFKQPPDFENPQSVDGDNTYTFTVSVSDGTTSTVPVDASVTVTDVVDDTAVNEVPRISLYLANSSVEENSDGIVVAYTAADPEGAELVWVLGGDDGDLFRVQQLGITPVYAVRFKQPPDFENPQSVDGDNTYTFTVSVSDGTTSTVPVDASVTVTDVVDDTAVNEVPRISLYLANSSVEENSDGIVVAYTAADPEGAELVWVLGGDDGDLFRVQQLGITPVYAVRFKQPPDFENPQSVDGDNTYTFTVSVSDGTTSTVPVDASVTVTDVVDDTAVNEVPRISLYLANSSVEENSDGIVVAYTAADPEGAELVWVLGGDDGDLFRVQQLGITPVYAVRFKQPPDFENPQSVDGDNTYTFTVSVSDGTTSTVPVDASVTVTDVDEGGAQTTQTSPVGEPAPTRDASEAFSDVAQGAYYEAAVTWMLQNNITTGCSDSAFCPTDPVSRRQVMTFLWRAAGSPEPGQAGSSVFSDVTAGGYADKAIGWAAEHGITTGCSDSAFCPTDPVSRWQVMTFLWRAAGSPEPGQAGSSVFSDVTAGGYADKAIGWAAEHGITTGCATGAFCPDDTATRAQTAAIIHRYSTTVGSGASPQRVNDR